MTSASHSPPSDLFLHFFQRESIPVEGLSGMSHTEETMMLLILPWDDSLSEPRLLDGRQRGWGNTDAFTSVYSLKFSRISLEILQKSRAYYYIKYSFEWEGQEHCGLEL